MVSSSFTGNLHPTPCIDWMQGRRGDPGCMAKAFMHPLQHVTSDHVCHYSHTHCAVHVLLSWCDCTRILLQCVACEARLFVTTGTPVQPHSMNGLNGLDVECRWVRCPPIIFEHVGFATNAAILTGFCDQFGCDALDEDMRVVLPVITSPSYPLFMVYIRLIHTPHVIQVYTTRPFVLCCSLHAHRIEYTPLHMQDTVICPEYVPNEQGLRHDLPDSVEVRVRLHRVGDNYQVTH